MQTLNALEKIFELSLQIFVHFRRHSKFLVTIHMTSKIAIVINKLRCLTRYLFIYYCTQLIFILEYNKIIQNYNKIIYTTIAVNK